MVLRTVRVPKQHEQVFEKAEQTVSAYFQQRREDPSKGVIEIFGERYVMVRAAALSVEFFDLVRGFFGAEREGEADIFSRHMLFDLAHAVGRADAQLFQKRMGLKEPIDRLSAGPVHFAYTGWAFVEILQESRPTPDEHYFLLYDHPYSFEADAWMRSRRKVGFPVCVMNAGYSSGWCQHSFGLKLVASEILCRARGDACCRFVMAPPEHIEEHIKQYIDQSPDLANHIKGYEIPDWFVRKRIEEELRSRMEEIERLNRLMIGREMRVLEIKREVNALLAQSGQPPRYKVDV